ncbi:MAG TPA: hypothetical protein VMT52_09555 [Planctomycetota bacterium]|nr:hypothetical protein [Planctomycetota bacterium]
MTPRAVFRFVIVLLLLGWALPSVPRAADTHEAGDDLPASTAPAEAGDLVRCPDCNESGRAPCGRCQGKGELTRTCEKCRGSGSRPCTLCSRESRGAAFAGEGRLFCERCGGRGQTGAMGKPCLHCGGEKTMACTSCSGRGAVRCKKTVTGKICPDCHFVGKVVCPTCKGSLLVSPEDLRSRATPKRSPSQAREDREVDLARSAGKLPPVEELKTRFAKLTDFHEAHADILADDPRPHLDLLRAEAGALKGRLVSLGLPPRPPGEETAVTAAGDAGAPRPNGSAALEIDAYTLRLGRFRRRWTELREVFDRERRSYQKTKAAWDSRAAKVDEVPRHLKTEVDEFILNQVDINLRISEDATLTLEKEEPAWLLSELAGLRATWTEIQQRAEKEIEARLAAAEAERGKNKKERLAKAEGARGKDAKGTIAVRPTANGRKADGGPRPEASPAPRGEPTPVATSAADMEIEEEGAEWEDEREAETKMEAEADTGTDTGTEMEVEAVPRERKASRPRKPESGSEFLPRLGWASIGAAIALAIFLLARRVSSRT